MFSDGTEPVFEPRLNWSSIVIKNIITHCGLVTQIWINIGSSNGLLPDGSKPLPEPVLTNLAYHQWYRKTSNISRTLVGDKIIDNSYVVGDETRNV